MIASQLAWAAEVALHAPSILNTQPWRWHVTGDGLELWSVPDRRLAATDPDGRLLTVSCGAALQHALVALAAGGDATRVEALPDPGRPDLLARVTVTGPLPAAVAERHQAPFAAIHRRRTDRRPFAPEPVPDAALADLRSAAEAEGTHLLILRDSDVVRLAVAVAHAADVQADDPDQQRELAEWTHREQWAGDGVPAATSVPAAVRRVPLRAFHPVDAADDADGDHDRFARYGIIWGEEDDPAAWLRAGQALGAILVEATVAGLAVSPISDVIEVEGTRELVRRLLTGLGHPFLVVRIGVPQPGPVPAAPRRDPSTVID